MATAAALSRSGHGVTVVEQGDGLRASGLAINLWSNASRYLSISAEIRAFVLAALGLGAAWLIDLDLFGVLAIATRDSAIGVTVTGLMIGGRGVFLAGDPRVLRRPDPQARRRGSDAGEVRGCAPGRLIAAGRDPW